MVAINLSMLTRRGGGNYVCASNNANTYQILRRWIPEATEQNLIKFILHLYHELQSTFSVLEDKMFLVKRFLPPLSFEMQTGSEPNTEKCKTNKIVLHESFAHSLARYHAQITIFSHKMMIKTIFKNSDKHWKMPFLQVRQNCIKLKFSNVLYRFLVCYIMLNLSAATSHLKVGSLHSEQEFCNFGLFDKIQDIVFN